jgi:hypothetical protein
VRCAEKGEVVVDVEWSASTTSWMLLGGLLSGVINFRLEQVKYRGAFRFRSSCLSRVHDDYHFYVIGCSES